MPRETETSKTLAPTRVGPIRTVGLLVSGVPITGKRVRSEWRAIRTHRFPIMFIAVTAAFVHCVMVRNQYGYWILPGTRMFGIIWPDVADRVIVVFFAIMLGVAAQFAVTSTIWHLTGASKEDSWRKARNVVYFSAVPLAFVCPAFVVIDSAYAASWTTRSLAAAIVVLVLAESVRLIVVAQGVRLTKGGWGLLGVVAAITCPELVFIAMLALRSFLLAVCLAVVVSAVLLLAPRDPRPTDNECETCGYDLTGNVSGRCPECGEVIPVEADDGGPGEE